jgi:hypothetical protein
VEAIKLPPGMPLNPAPSNRRSMADVTREEWARAQKIREQWAQAQKDADKPSSGKLTIPKTWSY